MQPPTINGCRNHARQRRTKYRGDLGRGRPYCALGVQDPLLELTYETTSDDVPDWDSMNHITLLVEIEAYFDIQFPMAEIEELRSVGELVQAIKDRLSLVHP
jgi:acyl carrier protein